MLHLQKGVLISKRSSGNARLSRPTGRTAENQRTSSARYPRSLYGAYQQKREFQKAIALAKEMTLAFWNGSKQLWANFQQSRKLKAARQSGKLLTRAEQRFIARTHEDLWKLGPIVFLNLLPASIVFLGLYIAAVPGALPSTIHISAWVEKSKQAAKKNKIAGAEAFLEHVKSLVNSTPETNDCDHVLTPQIRQQISELMKKVEAGQYIAPAEIKSLSKPFETVMDVVEMERPLLTASSNLVGLAAFRLIPLPFKIARLTKHFGTLSKDDKLVLEMPKLAEQLTDEELDEFIEERGMSTEGLTRAQKLRWASDWLAMAKDASIVPATYLLFAAANTKATSIPSFAPKSNGKKQL